MIRRFNLSSTSTMTSPSLQSGTAATHHLLISSRHATGWFSGLFSNKSTRANNPVSSRQPGRSSSLEEGLLYSKPPAQSPPPPPQRKSKLASLFSQEDEPQYPQGFTDGPQNKSPSPSAGAAGAEPISTKAPAPPEPPTAHALCAAAIEGNLERVRELMQRGAPANIAPNASGLTALHSAAMAGNSEIVDFILNSGPRAPSPMLVVTKDRITPLHVACAHNRADCVRVLCRKLLKLDLPMFKDPVDQTLHGAIDVRANDERVTALHLAVKFSTPEVVEELLRAGADPTLFTSEPEPQSPVSVACLRGDLALLKLLFVNAIKLPGMTEHRLVELTSPHSGTTPLQVAAGAGQLDVVKFLVEECNADPRRCRNSGGNDGNKEAAANEDAATARMRREEAENALSPHPPLYLAAYGGHVETVRYFLEKCNMKPDEQLVGDGASALHAACKNGSAETVKLLLKHGADKMRRRTETHIVPAHVASLHGHLDVLKLLFPPVTPLPPLPLVEVSGYTCLHLAIVGGPHVECLEYLLSVGFEPEISARADSRKMTPLHLAAEAGSAKAIKALLSRVSKEKAHESNAPSKMESLVNARDTIGLTAMHAAAHCGSIDSLQALLEAGADMGLADREGQTPMLLAKTAGHGAAVEFLQQHAMATKTDIN